MLALDSVQAHKHTQLRQNYVGRFAFSYRASRTDKRARQN